jgi:hypothetical protein
MSSITAPRCRHIKVSGTQCGSPAVRSKSFCFYHQQHRPILAECYSDGEYATGEILLPVFEDAHSVQSVIRQVMQMLLQKRIERRTASLLLYALQIASSNLKRMELEKPQPEQVVIDVVTPLKYEPPIAAPEEIETATETSASAQPQIESSEADLPPGTIQACHRSEPLHTQHNAKHKSEHEDIKQASSSFPRDSDAASIPSSSASSLAPARALDSCNRLVQ